MSLYTLSNLDNYKSEYECTITEAFKCYTGIITNYLVYIFKIITIFTIISSISG